MCVLVYMQLDETYSVVLSSYSTPPSRLGNYREVNITVRKNDDPFGVIEFVQSGLTVTINESKGDLIFQGNGKNKDTLLCQVLLAPKIGLILVKLYYLNLDYSFFLQLCTL